MTDSTDAMSLFTDLQEILSSHPNKNGEGTVIKNILIREAEPIRLELPRGLEPLGMQAVEHNEGVFSLGMSASNVWSREDLTNFFKVLDPDWNAKISEGAVDRPVAISGNRLRANLYSYNGDFNLDTSTLETGKLGLALRVFPSRIPTLGQLGLPPAAAEAINSRRGMILLTGGTGAGKSTTAASMVDAINESRTGHIITIESPIEYTHEAKKCVITQREVGANVSSMARGVYDAMRQFPIAILIGEIREHDAATAALYAGESGHLVLGTLHSNSAVGGLSKMAGFFSGSEQIAAESLSQSVLAVIGQTLVPTIDEQGWTPIYETIVLNDSATRDLISKRDWSTLQSLLREGGSTSMQSLNASFMRAIRDKLITEEVALQYSYDRPHLLQLLKK